MHKQALLPEHKRVTSWDPPKNMKETRVLPRQLFASGHTSGRLRIKPVGSGMIGFFYISPLFLARGAGLTRPVNSLASFIHRGWGLSCLREL